MESFSVPSALEGSAGLLPLLLREACGRDLRRRGRALQHGGGGGGGLLPGSRGWTVSGWRSQGPPLPKVRGTQVRVPKCSRAPLPWPGEGRRAVGAGGQAAGPASPSKATGCQVPGSWARWGTRAGYSPRSCCTEPPEMVGSAMCPCSTRSVPSGSFHQLPDRSCAPAVQRMGRQTEKPN